MTTPDAHGAPPRPALHRTPSAIHMARAAAAAAGMPSSTPSAVVGGVARSTHGASAARPVEVDVVWAGMLCMMTPTRNGLVRCRAERYGASGGARIASPFQLPFTIYLSSHRIVAGNTVLMKLRQPRVQWVLRFYPTDTRDAACVERLASVLAERSQVVEVGLETGASLYLFGAGASALASGGGGLGASEGHVLLAAYAPPSMRPRQVRVKGVGVMLAGFSSEAPVRVPVQAMRPHRLKKPTRNTAYVWPSTFVLHRSQFVARESLPALKAWEAMWHVSLVPEYAPPDCWHPAIAYVDASQLAVEVLTTDRRWSLIITTQIVDGYGLAFIGAADSIRALIDTVRYPHFSSEKLVRDSDWLVSINLLTKRDISPPVLGIRFCGGLLKRQLVEIHRRAYYAPQLK